MYGRRFHPEVKALALPTAVIADMDGTLVDVSSVRHHAVAGQYDEFHAASRDCPPHPMAIDWVRSKFEEGHTILVVSARMQRWHELSTFWLAAHVTTPHLGPFLRADGDYRPDHEVKREIYAQLSQHYRIIAAIDDRPQVVELWKELGLDVTVVPGWSEDSGFRVEK